MILIITKKARFNSYYSSIHLTIVLKSMINASLLLLPHCLPPNNTARWPSIMVKEKALQGGGLVPLTVGEDHVPAMDS